MIDRRNVATGSANLTASGTHGDAGAARIAGNANHILRIDSPALAELFAGEFALMWGERPLVSRYLFPCLIGASLKNSPSLWMAIQTLLQPCSRRFWTLFSAGSHRLLCLPHGLTRCLFARVPCLCRSSASGMSPAESRIWNCSWATGWNDLSPTSNECHLNKRLA